MYFTVVVYRKKYLKRRLVYCAGHGGSFNPSIITNKEAHMVYGNMEKSSRQKNGGPSTKITTFFRKVDQTSSGIKLIYFIPLFFM